MTSKLSINRSLVPGTCLVRLSGILNEDFNRQEIAQIAETIVVFDLDNVQRITSFGVREWLTALRELRAEYYAFLNCRPAVISQFNMVAGFGGQGQLITFYAPYICQTCDKEIETLIDLRHQYAEVVAGKLPRVVCPSCQGEAEFDDIPENYFSYISTHPAPQVPPLAARLIENIQERFSVQKEVQDRVTGVWLSGPLDNSAHFKRLVDGLEGYVVVVTAAISEVTIEGLTRFEKLTSAADLQVYLARVPLQLASALASQRIEMGRTKLASLWLPFGCVRCKKTFEVEADHAFLSRYTPGGFGEMQCPHCERTTNLQQIQYPQAWQILQAVRPFLVAQVPADVANYLETHPGVLLSDPVADFPIMPSSTSLPAIDKTLVVTPPPTSSGRHRALGGPNTPSPVPSVVQAAANSGRRCPICKSVYPLGLNICPRDGAATVLESEGPAVGDPLIGRLAGSYRILSPLSEGGMGKVYSAEHASLGKKVAVKVLHREYAQSAAVVERFFEEARAASQLGHEHIVDIHDFGVLDGMSLPYFVMEYLEGESLEDLLNRETKLAPEVAISIALQLLDALSAAHKKGIIHRDLKPDNIFLLQRKSEKYFVKLLDFGVAKLVSSEGPGSQGKALTQVGALIGTPRYMSPEQAQGKSSQIDARADLYSVGVILFQMLCGQTPFPDGHFSDLVMAHISTPPPQLRALNPKISPALEQVVLKSLAKAKEERYQSAEEMAQALQKAAKGVTAQSAPPYLPTSPPVAPPPAPRPPLPPAPRASTFSGLNGEMAPMANKGRWRVAFVLGLLGLLLGVLGAAVIFWPSGNKSSKISTTAIPEEPLLLKLESEPSGAEVTVTINGKQRTLGQSPTELTVPYGAQIEVIFSKDGMRCSKRFTATQEGKIPCTLTAVAPSPE